MARRRLPAHVLPCGEISDAEQAMLNMLSIHRIDGYVREFKFVADRDWRFDFAWPGARFAVEVEGLTREGGRPQRLPGFVDDCEKYEAALNAGWIVYRVPPQWIYKGSRPIWREQMLSTICQWQSKIAHSCQSKIAHCRWIGAADRPDLILAFGWGSGVGRRERSDRNPAPERARRARSDPGHDSALSGGSPGACERSLDRHRF